jgi:pilus assembly protein Flp/PilA
MFASLHRFLVSEDGPTAVEYAVMLALIIIVCLAAIAFLGGRSSAAFSQQEPVCRRAVNLVWLADAR